MMNAAARSLEGAPRVLVAEDQSLVRAGLRRVLEEGGCAVVGEAADGAQAIERYEAERPDVLLLDVVMPEKDGYDVTRELTARYPDARILALSLHMDTDHASRLLRLGVTGVIDKNAKPEDLLVAVRTVARGERYLEPGLRLASDAVTSLSDREIQVLRLLVDGVKNRDIAARLHVSTKTVDSHRANILRKLNLGSNVELVRYAIRHELIEP